MKSVPQKMETPLDLPLPLMALFKVMVPMPSDHNILILVEDATFRLKFGYIYVSKEDGTDFYYMHRCLYKVSCIYIHRLKDNDNMYVEFIF